MVMNGRSTCVVGTASTRFGMTPAPAEELVREAGLGALRAAGLSYADVGHVVLGTMMAGGGPRLAKELGVTGIPVQRVENASATGACAFREASLAVAHGDVDVALAIGVETLVGLGMTGGADPSSQVPVGLEASIPPMAWYAMMTQRRMYDYGTTIETIAEVAAKSWTNARCCPWAHRKSDHDVTAAEVLASRVVAEPLRSMMCCPFDAGAAAVVVASEEYARRFASGQRIRVLAGAFQTEKYVEGHLFMGPVVGPAEMTRDTALEAYEQSGVGPSDLDLVQVHDAFAIEEIIDYELLGLCAEGDGDKLITTGATSLGGSIPVSTDGGLLARGHPGGPSGLAQIHETYLQLTGRAGERQVEDPRIGLCHLVGIGSCCVVHIFGK
jgi:acetyl-CoA acetyltransferase